MPLSPPLRLLLDLQERGIEVRPWGDRLILRPPGAVSEENREALACYREELLSLLAPARFGLGRPDLPALLALHGALAGRPLPRDLPGLVAWARRHRRDLAAGEERAARVLSARLAPGEPRRRTIRGATLWRRRLERIRRAARQAGEAVEPPLRGAWLLPYSGPLRAFLEALAEGGLVRTQEGQVEDDLTGRLLAAFDGEEVPTEEAVPIRPSDLAPVPRKRLRPDGRGLFGDV